MDLVVDVRAADVLRGLGLAEKRVEYAVVNAVNKTIKLAQSEERLAVRAGFTVRKPEFMLRQAAVIRGRAGGSGFASVKDRRFEARMQVGEKPRLLLSKFEEGGRRTPFKGKHVAVPIPGGPARPSERQSVPEAFTFKGMAFVKSKRAGRGRMVKGKTAAHQAGQRAGTRRGASRAGSADTRFRSSRTRAGKTQWKGARRTFILDHTRNAPYGGVFQRVGPGRDDIRLVWSFAAALDIRPTLKFVERARKVSARAFPPALLAEISATIKFAFGRTGTL